MVIQTKTGETFLTNITTTGAEVIIKIDRCIAHIYVPLQGKEVVDEMETDEKEGILEG